MRRLLNIILVYSFALLFLSIIAVKAFDMMGAMESLDAMSGHGKIAMWITIILGLGFGGGIGGLFFYLAHDQSRRENTAKKNKAKDPTPKE